MCNEVLKDIFALFSGNFILDVSVQWSKTYGKGWGHHAIMPPCELGNRILQALENSFLLELSQSLEVETDSNLRCDVFC